MFLLHVEPQLIFLMKRNVASLTAQVIVSVGAPQFPPLLLLQDGGRNLPEETGGQTGFGLPRLLPLDWGEVIVLQAEGFQAGDLGDGHFCADSFQAC